MADQKISELNTITGANVDDASDKLAIVDASGNETKAITREELFKSVDGTTFHVDSANNRVGVGTTTPSVKMEVDGDVAVSNAFPTVQLRDKNSTGTSIGGLFALTNVDATDPIAWFGVPDEDGVVHVRAFYGDIVLRPGSSASTTEVMRVQDNGRVGIGTSSPSVELDVVGASQVSGDFSVNTDAFYVDAANRRVGIRNSAPDRTLQVGDGTSGAAFEVNAGSTPQVILKTDSDASSFGRIIFENAAEVTAGRIEYSYTDNDMRFYTNAAEVMRIDSSGNVGIGTTSPSAALDVVGDAEISGDLTVDTSTLHVDSTNNRVGIGTTSPTDNLQVNSSGNTRISLSSTFTNSTNDFTFDQVGDGARGRIVFAKNDVSRGTIEFNHAATASGLSYGFNASGSDLLSLGYSETIFKTNNTERLRIDSSGNVGIGTSSPSEKLDVSGNVTISGSLSKGSGSFKIDHPLKPETHHLVHSFVEAPQADNIYRGRVDLVNGVATVNLDESGRMTEGTFVLLNGNVQCFTSNETDWCPVRGSVNGNILTIEAQDSTCTDTISWLVIGERIDQHMIYTNWTDENGRIIVEPEKVIMEPEEEVIV